MKDVVSSTLAPFPLLISLATWNELASGLPPVQRVLVLP
jgi:hypothetical protein